MKSKNIILGVTGSIAAYKACDIISKLKESGLGITVVMTQDAQEFITPLTLQTLSGNKVYCDIFEIPKEWELLHTSLADKADLFLIAPATADIIGKLAAGICDELLVCAILATKAPVVIAPAMNENMYLHKIVQENIRRLKAIGYKFVGPIRGRLACGGKGMGHIAATEDIVREVKNCLKTKKSRAS